MTDTETGAVKTYQNTAGNCGGIDEDAFPANGANAVSGATPLLSATRSGAALTFPSTAALRRRQRAATPPRGSCVPAAGALCSWRTGASR